MHLQAAASTASDQGSSLLMYGIIAVMVVMMFMSSRKRKKQAAELQTQLVVGAKVMLHSGIVGRVLEINDDGIVIESAGSKLLVVRQAVRTVSVWESKEDAAEADAQPGPAEAISEAAPAAPKAPRKRVAKPAAEKTEN